MNATSTNTANFLIIQSVQNLTENLRKDADELDLCQYQPYYQGEQLVIGHPDEIDLDIVLTKDETKLFNDRISEVTRQINDIDKDTITKALTMHLIRHKYNECRQIPPVISDNNEQDVRPEHNLPFKNENREKPF
ncbi:hypothetical protein I3271_00925 [Photobacterium leiognathi]|uniref:hypothetical protein n=1 Tax=Photobacterium leiognathi TaxID=553611 RepID=UPI001EDCC36B|nr:hypothetical protein [Photobacterium leiognathi]MCG3883245.1 hypothetical protein [Photobacterium leiognathi]